MIGLPRAVRLSGWEENSYICCGMAFFSTCKNSKANMFLLYCLSYSQAFEIPAHRIFINNTLQLSINQLTYHVY